MPIKSSGSLGANEIQAEFGDTGDFVINEYYGAAAGLPTSGQIAWSDFYGKSSPGQLRTYTNQRLFSIGVRHDRRVDVKFDLYYMTGVVWDATPSFMYIETAANAFGSGSFYDTLYPNGIEPLGTGAPYYSISVNMTGTSSRSPASIVSLPNSTNGWNAIFRLDDSTPPGATRSTMQGNFSATPTSSFFAGPWPRFDRTMAGPYAESDTTQWEQYVIAPYGSYFLFASASFPDGTTGGGAPALSVISTTITSTGATIRVRNEIPSSSTYSLGRWNVDLRTRTTSNVMAMRLRAALSTRYRGTTYARTAYLYIHYLESYPYVAPPTGDGA